TSMCHAWSCTPTALLSEEILGVRYDASTRTVTFAPQQLDLKWAKGVAPMKCGDITVEWTAAHGKRIAKITAPKSVSIHIGASQIAKIDGKLPKESAALTGGTHEIEFVSK